MSSATSKKKKAEEFILSHDHWVCTLYTDLSNEDIFYFGNLPYDVLSPVGSNGAYYYSRIRYTF